MTRGRFLEWLLGLGSAALTALSLRGAAAVLAPPSGLGRRVKAWHRVLGPEDLPPDGEAVKVVVDGAPYVIRLNGYDVFAWSAACPHAGCVVELLGPNAAYWCACHGSTFDPETGAPTKGPAATPLTIVEARWGKGDVVEVLV